MIDFIGVGAQKAGTSWVYACLYEHPEICAPLKEIHFFSRPRFENGKEWYESYFKNCKKGTKKGEFSTSYLYSEEAPARIKELYPEVRLIAILRNPIGRAYSHYRNSIKAGEIPKDMSFEAFCEREKSCLEQGLYSNQLKRYFRHFNRDQILILVYEDSKKNPEQFIKTIYIFLNIDQDFRPAMLHTEVNIARTPKFVGIDRLMHSVAELLRKAGLDKLVWLVKKSGATDAVRLVNTEKEEKGAAFDRKKLKDFYKQDVKELGILLSRDLSKEWNI